MSTVLVPVIPQPKQVSLQPGKSIIDKKTLIVLPENPGGATLLCAQLIRERVKFLTGIEIKEPIAHYDPNYKGLQVLIGIPENCPALMNEMNSRNLSLTAEIGKEGYFLCIDSSIVLIAASNAIGVFYGTQTLLQLMEMKRSHIELPNGLINDYPLLSIRGISDDISRGQISTLEDFKKILRQLASFKINLYMPYIEDMFQFESYPEIGLGREPLTKSEVRELVEYAAQYHIEIIPIFQTLAHQDRLLSIPKFEHMSESSDEPGCFSPVVEETYTFLDNCIRELAEVFKSPTICIGCDETYILGKGKSKELAAQIGVDGVFAHHVKRVKEIVEKYGKKVWMYGDMPFEKNLPEAKDKLPKDVVMINWIYSIAPEYERVHLLKEWGFTQIVSPAVHGWGRLFPDFEEANANVDNLIHDGHKNGAIGMIQSAWCDFGAENYREFNWYSYAYSADAGWNPDHLHREWFDDVYFKKFYGTDNSAIRKIHKKLAQSNRKFKWYYATTGVALWRDQIVDQCTKFIKNRVARSRELAKLHDDIEKLLPIADKTVTEYRDHIELFKMVNQRIKLLSFRLLIPERQKELNHLLADNSNSFTKNQTALKNYIAFIEEQKRLLAAIKVEFQRLWLKYYRHAMLNENLTKYDKLSEYYDSLISNANKMLKVTNS